MSEAAKRLLQFAEGWGRINARVRELHFHVGGGDDAVPALAELHLMGMCEAPEPHDGGRWPYRAKLTERGFHLAAQLDAMPDARSVH